jgi:hypothetical protein
MKEIRLESQEKEKVLLPLPLLPFDPFDPTCFKPRVGPFSMLSFDLCFDRFVESNEIPLELFGCRSDSTNL